MTARRPLVRTVAAASLVLCSSAALENRPADIPRRAARDAYVWTLPPGVPRPIVPADNPMSEAKVSLGRRLFYDTRLSGTGTFACATCHQQRYAFTDGRARAVGSLGGEHRRSTMSLANVAFNVSFGWADPSRRSLEAQMEVPMFNEHPVEMGLTGKEPQVLARFSGAADVDRFRKAFPGEEEPVTLANIVKAIAAFERTLISGDSPFDRYLYRDDRSAMPPAALRGMRLFFSERLACAQCHASFNLSGPVTFRGARTAGPSFHNTGLVGELKSSDLLDGGLFDVSGHGEDVGRFRAPTLRNIAVTAPYMHDGSVPTLEAAIAHYASGGQATPLRSRLVRGFTITAAETADLVAFLESLTDRAFLTNPAFGDPEWH